MAKSDKIVYKEIRVSSIRERILVDLIDSYNSFRKHEIEGNSIVIDEDVALLIEGIVKSKFLKFKTEYLAKLLTNSNV